MSAPATPCPESPQQLHQRLIDGDPTAPSDLAVAFLDLLIDWLQRRNPTIHPDCITEAAEDAILALIRNPTSYRPHKASLESYLRMSAQGDLLNLLNRETAHRQEHQSLEIVELSDDAGKYLGRRDDPLDKLIEEEGVKLANEASEPFRATLTPEEAAAFDLMQASVRSYAAYAEACGYTDRPPAEQKILVKRIKDRLQKRLAREKAP